MVLKPWDARSKSQFVLKKPLQTKLSQIAGLQAFALIPPPLPGGGGGPPVQFVIKTTSDFQSLFDVSTKLFTKAKNSGLFIYSDNTLKFNQPEIEFAINRAKASEMGLDMKAYRF